MRGYVCVVPSHPILSLHKSLARAPCAVSQILDVRSPDLARCPKFAEAEFEAVTVEPGEVRLLCARLPEGGMGAHCMFVFRRCSICPASTGIR